MNRTIVIIAKNVKLTAMMRHFDVFEPSKFVGNLAEATQTTHTNLTAAELLKRLRKNNTAEFETVGVIIPHGDAAFVPNHTVYSTGEKWTTIDELCRSYRSKRGTADVS
jgi:hypothetical protein